MLAYGLSLGNDTIATNSLCADHNTADGEKVEKRKVIKVVQSKQEIPPDAQQDAQILQLLEVKIPR